MIINKITSSSLKTKDFIFDFNATTNYFIIAHLESEDIYCEWTKQQIQNMSGCHSVNDNYGLLLLGIGLAIDAGIIRL